MKKSRRTYNGVHLNKKSNTQDVVEQSLTELTNSNIVEVNGEKWILSKRYKTKVPFQVKLLDTPLQIIERYRPCQEDNLIFPNLNYWSICKSLKKGMKECG